MAMNMDAAIRISANVKGANAVQAFNRDLKGLDGAAKLSSVELGKMNIAINRMAREAGNTTAGLRQHLSALQNLRDRVEIGGKAYNRLGAEIDQLKGKLRGLDGQVERSGSGLRESVGAALAGLGLGAAAGSVIKISVDSVESERRLKSLAQGFDQYSVVQSKAAESAKLFGITQTQANQEFAQIYARLRPIGLSLEQVSTAYNGFNTAAKLSGASSAESSAAFLQLSQALGTGVLRGEELNAVFEQTPAVVQAIAREMGVPIGRIRELAEQGKITGDIVLRALASIEREGAPKLAEAMKGPAQQFKNLQNASDELQKAIGVVLVPAVVAGAQGLTALLKGIDELPEPVKNLTAVVVIAGGAVGGLVISLAAFKALGIGAAITAAATALKGLTVAAAAAKVQMIALNAVALLNPWVRLAAVITAATIALAGYRSESQKLAGAAAKGDPAAISQAKQSISRKEAQLQALEQRRGRSRGPERASIDRETTRLRREVTAERAAVQQGQKATPSRALPAVPVIPAAGVSAAPAAAGGGGGGRTGRAGGGGADQAAKAAAAAASKVQSSGIELTNARELYDIEGRILDARLQDNQQLILARNAQKELLSIRQQAAAILADKELPAAAKKNALDKLAVQSATVSRQLQFDIAELENKRAATAQESIDKLIDERELLHARLNGNEAEVMLRQQLRDLTKGMTDDEKARAEALLRGNEALRQQKEAADEMKRLYGDIGMTIKDGVVGAIQGAIDGTKSLQEVASNLLQNIANKLLDVAINMALFGAMSGTGTGGGLLGFLFKKNAKGNAYASNGIVPFAKGGLVTAPTLFPFAKGVGLMGEAGPEAIMPLKRLPSGRLGVEAAGGGGGGITVNVAVDAKGSRVEGDQQQGAALGRAISAAVQAELVKQQRPGGLLAGAR